MGKVKSCQKAESIGGVKYACLIISFKTFGFLLRLKNISKIFTLIKVTSRQVYILVITVI